MTPDDEYRRRRAYHEAGHVVAALRYGRRVHSVTVPPLQGGETKVDNLRFKRIHAAGPPFTPEDEAHLKEEMRIRASGRAAEIVILGNASSESDNDMAWIAEVAALLGIRAWDTWQFELDAVDVMRQPAALERVHAIADAVLSRESLFEEEILALASWPPEPKR